MVALLPVASQAQIDPFKRRLIEAGYNQSLEGRGPTAAYAYYYYNDPGYPRTNQTLRLVLAPVYLDGELGFHKLLGEQTDFALGLGGGGFADSHAEVRGGKYLREESFTGHGGSLSASVYHLFNPAQTIPLNGLLRGSVRHTAFSRNSETAAGFALPRDFSSFALRAGLRWGGRGPVLTPDAAMELSVWYEGQFRDESMGYGFAGDRNLAAQTHLFWARALLNYTLPDLQHQFSVRLTTGVSLDADRLSAYRLGAALPLNSEFPLSLPGYYFQELTARRFLLAGGLYTVPLDAARQWSLQGFGSTALVDYLHGLEQPGHWHSGVGGGLGWRSRDNVWQVVAGYAYGVDALRNGERGAHSVGFIIQCDLEARPAKTPFDPGVGPDKSRFLDRLFAR